MPPTVEEKPTTEFERVINWRVWNLVEAGMTYDDAWRMARTERWRDALDLMENGCPPDLAFDIVR